MPPRARKTALRAVNEDETAATEIPPKRLNVAGAAEGGTRRDLLVAMQSRIAKAIDSPDTPPRDIAALSRRLMEIAKEIEIIDFADGDDDIGRAAATADEGWDESAI